MSEASDAMLLVDAANVIGSRPNGWWRDRSGAARRFVESARDAVVAGRLDPPVVVVLEGRARDGAAESTADGVEVIHAHGIGDDTIAALAADACDPSAHPAVVVTADRELAGRVRRAGGDVVGPTWLLDRLA